MPGSYAHGTEKRNYNAKGPSNQHGMEKEAVSRSEEEISKRSAFAIRQNNHEVCVS